MQPLCCIYKWRRWPVTAAAIISSIMLAWAACSPSASCLDENYVETVGPLIDFVSNNRPKLKSHNAPASHSLRRGRFNQKKNVPPLDTCAIPYQFLSPNPIPASFSVSRRMAFRGVIECGTFRNILILESSCLSRGRKWKRRRREFGGGMLQSGTETVRGPCKAN